VAAQAKITSQAQGIPLFAVETVRALIDRDIVQPIEGAYRLVGDIGELAVPDSLHALLAARLDALDPDVRRLVADAAVLGSTFPAEALIAVSERDETEVRAALADLARREVFSVSADHLSPEKGSYGFAQQMLRQVAYDTLSRRDRKTRHLRVGAYLRAAFAGDGEEMTDVIARHYLDALEAVPDDPDAGEIRGQAIGALIRAAERAERTGAPALAAASYATAAELSFPDSPHGEQGANGPLSAGGLWERAARAAETSGDWAAAVEDAGRARDYHLQRGQVRAAARAQATAGQALRYWGRHSEAREQLTAAVEVLRAEPDADTVRALDQLAMLEVFAGSPDADRLSTEGLTLGQALDVDTNTLGSLFVTRGIFLNFAGRRRFEGASYFREAARLATQAGDNLALGRALADLADPLAVTDPAAAAEAARAAATHLRRVGARGQLMVAITNLAQALVMLGDWDSAEAELTQSAEADGLAGNEDLACYRGWLAALRGDTATAETMLAGLGDLRATEDPQDKAQVSLVEAFTAAAHGRAYDALRHARGALAHADALGIGHEFLRWAWPLAARSAHELDDAAAARELLALLDSCQPGHLVPMQRAERDLARTRLAANDSDPAATTIFAAAISGLRELSTPYHLAHGLLDYAQHLTRTHDTEAADAIVGEARHIARNLRCQPLLDRAADMTSEKSPAADQIAALSGRKAPPASAGLSPHQRPD
jgi:tetratricopeptide (TPR) repeat protein